MTSLVIHFGTSKHDVVLYFVKPNGTLRRPIKAYHKKKETLYLVTEINQLNEKETTLIEFQLKRQVFDKRNKLTY